METLKKTWSFLLPTVAIIAAFGLIIRAYNNYDSGRSSATDNSYLQSQL